MIIHKCDRCGQDIDLVESYSPITMYNGKRKLVMICGESYDRGKIDLCKSCWKSFQTWFSKDLPPVEDTILGRQEDLSDQHPQETR